MKRSIPFFVMFLWIFFALPGEGREWTLKDLTGITGDIALEGPSPSFSLYLPVPPGLRFRESTLSLEYVASPLLSFGSTLSVYGENTLLASFEVRPGEHRTKIPLAPLEELTLQDTLRIEIRGNFRHSENLCEDLLSRDLFVRIRPESRFLLSLDEGAWTVRDLLRVPASRVHTFLPEDLSSPRLLEAYLKLYAFLRRRGQTVITEILPQRMPEKRDGELRIVLRERGLRDVELFGSTLYLTPRGVSGILAEPSLFVGRSFNTSSSPLFWRTKRTLRDFGMRSTTLRGIGELRQTVYFTLADLGGTPASLYLTLLSSSIPLPETPGGEALLKVFLNGNLVFTRKIPKKARQGIEQDVIFLPPRLLGRENTLDIVFSYFPEVGACRRGTMPFEATIFEQSYFSGRIRRTLDTPTFSQAPTVFSGKAWVVLPEKPSLEEVEVMARLYGALREMDTTPLALEVVHALPEAGRSVPRFSLSMFLEAFKERYPSFLLTPPPRLREYFLVFDREGAFLSSVSRKNGTIAFAPLPHLETFSLTPDTPLGVLVAGELFKKPALIFTPLGRRDVACSAFLSHFRGAATLRTMEGNVALFAPKGWGETHFVHRFSSQETFSTWRTPLFVLTSVALAVWCFTIYRKLVRTK